MGGFVALGSVMLRPPTFSGPIAKRAPNIFLPDALIRSHSLSKLPPDLLRMPLARDVLTEDFVAYYEQNENRMSFSGTLRRIAFEHKLDFPEKLLESVLNEPAEVALWRDDAGRLKDFVIVLSRNPLTRIIQALLSPAVYATDMQLFSAGKLDGTDVEMLVLSYGSGHHLLLLSKGDRIVALSNPGMLLSEGNSQSAKAAEIIRELLDDEEPISPFAQHFLLEEPLGEKTHDLTLGTRAFALNYDIFMPGLAALSLSFDDQGAWQSAALLDGDHWQDDGESLWAALPHGAGLCAALPADWEEMAPALRKLNARQPQQQTTAKEFTSSFAGPAGVCWYKEAKLYAPLFAARLTEDANKEKVEEFFDLAARAIKAKEGGTSTEPAEGIALWQGEIDSRFGSQNSSGSRTLKPALAIQGDTVFFSPDAALVENALAVAAKRYPALSDSFPSKKGTTLAFVNPDAMAALLQDEMFAALPRNEEELFRNAAEAYLVPRLKALARYSPQAVVLPKKIQSNGLAWYPLEWKETKPAH
ncbi:MAG: DUF2138 family protein [Azoarcus sp.]|nr:DUF2138 family protein [Azoarcus sp.]